jgi:uncharacterized integral membrane protein
MALILYFGFLNMEERVTVRVSPATAGEFRHVPLALALFVAYLAGLATFALISVYRDLRMRAHVRGLRRENRKLLDELHQLRSVTLDDLPWFEEGSSEEGTAEETRSAPARIEEGKDEPTWKRGEQ